MGILAALLSAVFSTSKDIVSKTLAVRIDGTASTFASFAFALPFYLLVLAVLWLLGYDIFTFTAAFWWLVLARALTDVFAEGMKMYAFAHGDISLVSLIFSMSPLFLLVLSPLVTGDALSWPGAVALVLTVVGTLVLIRPAEEHTASQGRAIVLAVGASVFFALNTCFDRLALQQRQDEQPAAGTPDDPGIAVVAGFTMTLVSALLIAPLIVFRRDRQLGLVAYGRGLTVRGFLEVAFMSCKLLAIQSLSGPAVVGLQRSSLLLSIFAGRFVFRERDFVRRLLAAMLILAGVLWIAWEEGSKR